MILAVSPTASESAADAQRELLSVSWPRRVLHSTWWFSSCDLVARSACRVGGGLLRGRLEFHALQLAVGTLRKVVRFTSVLFSELVFCVLEVPPIY